MYIFYSPVTSSNYCALLNSISVINSSLFERRVHLSLTNLFNITKTFEDNNSFVISPIEAILSSFLLFVL